MATHKVYNKDFFKTWSSDMAYVLGFLYADGNISVGKRGNHYVAIYSADRYILVAIARAFGSTHKISKRSLSSGSVYRIQIGSKEWVEDLAVIGVGSTKTKRLTLPLIPDSYRADFVRGYFDGDGNVWIGTVNKHRSTPSCVIQVAFTSGCRSFLVQLHTLLQMHCKVTGGSMYDSKTRAYSRLAFSSGDALTIYKIMYNGRHKLFLKRKKVVFEQFIKIRGRSSAG